MFEATFLRHGAQAQCSEGSAHTMLEAVLLSEDEPRSRDRHALLDRHPEAEPATGGPSRRRRRHGRHADVVVGAVVRRRCVEPQPGGAERWAAFDDVARGGLARALGACVAHSLVPVSAWSAADDRQPQLCRQPRLRSLLGAQRLGAGGGSSVAAAERLRARRAGGGVDPERTGAGEAQDSCGQAAQRPHRPLRGWLAGAHRRLQENAGRRNGPAV
mmetsp:Transcript_177120/g.568032  ORF Transcript_177120/g.568032 Transcript_177120/m.568032 type:complete len:216 (-) Transcript_177120:71-718(-)